MVYRQRVILASIILSFAASVASAQIVTVWHEAPRCLPDRCRSPKLVAKVTSPERVDTVILYFRKQGEGDYYYTMMRPANDIPELYWGYLPVAKNDDEESEQSSEEDDIEFVEYYVEATDWSGVQSRSEIYDVEVSEACTVEELSAEEERIARHLVVGLTKPGQYPVPPGFRCAGIVASVTASGDLVPNEECRKQRAEDGDDSLCPIIWIKPTLIVVGAGTGGILIADEEPKAPQLPLSPARP